MGRWIGGARHTLIWTCRFLRSFCDSAACLLAWFSCTSISFRSPSIFFLRRTASLRDLASASKVACMDSRALWLLRLETQ